MKRKLLFIVTYFDIGGISRSLQNLLLSVDATLYEIDVFGMAHEGNCSVDFKNCRIFPKNIFMDCCVGHLNKKRGLSWIGSAVIKFLNRLFGDKLRQRIYSRTADELRRNGYDFVIAYSEGAPTEFVSYFHQQKKIAWIHCDYASYRSFSPSRNELYLYNEFNTVVCVSEFTRLSFLCYYPQMAKKVVSIYNLLDTKLIKSGARENMTGLSNREQFTIISVGRLDYVKRLSIIPELAKDIAKYTRKPFHWYIVGPKGGDLDEYEKLMKGIEKQSGRVSYCGEFENPYAWIHSSDLLVSTSISEACPYVINEAKILGVPVVCTNFGSSYEFVKSGVEGYVVDINDMAETIAKIIDSPDDYNRLRENLRSFEYPNLEIIGKLNRLFQV